MVAQKLWKQFYGIISNNKTSIVAVLLTVGSIILEAILDDLFVCPCVTSEEAIKACPASRNDSLTSTVDKYCLIPGNVALSVLLIVAPAVLLFMLSCLALSKWKGCIGCCSKSGKRGKGCLNCCCRGFVITILAPLTWINLMLLDGNYVACMSTPRPYKLQNEVCLNEKSEKYKNIYILSKDIGLGCTLLSSIITLFVFWTIKCCSDKNYYEQKYERLRQKYEDDIIDEFFRVKAEEDTAHVLQKLRRCSEKEMFNKILKSRKANKPLFERSNTSSRGGNEATTGRNNTQDDTQHEIPLGASEQRTTGATNSAYHGETGLQAVESV